MGSWGTGLYQSDDAADLRSEIDEHLCLPLEPEEIVARLSAGRARPPVSAEDCIFWLVMADRLHAHGIALAEVSETARRVVAEGTDLAARRALGLGERDLVKRAAVLAKLAETWAVPRPRPKRRRILAPEPDILQPGDLLRYPVRGGNPAVGTEPDATNAFVVLATARVFHGLRARQFVAPLLLFERGGPVGQADCLAAPFLVECSFSRRTFRPLGGWAAITGARLGQIGAEPIGRVALSTEAVRAVFGDRIATGPRSDHDLDIDPLTVELHFLSSIARGSIWGEPGQSLADLVRPDTGAP